MHSHEAANEPERVRSVHSDKRAIAGLNRAQLKKALQIKRQENSEYATKQQEHASSGTQIL
jgi:hypothetical protein